MTRVTLRGFAQRKLRALVTTLAVFLGVAFIAGGYVLTDTINASFDEILGRRLRRHRRLGLPDHARQLRTTSRRPHSRRSSSTACVPSMA